MKIDEVARKAEIHAQRLAVVDERAHMERKYHSDGQVHIFPMTCFQFWQFTSRSSVHTDDATSTSCIY